MVRTFGMFSLMKIWKMTNESIFSGLKLYKFYYIVVNYEFSDNIGSKIKENSEQSEESAPEALFVWSAFNHLIWCYNNSQVCMREGGTFRAKPWKQLCEQAKHSCFIFIWRKKMNVYALHQHILPCQNYQYWNLCIYFVFTMSHEIIKCDTVDEFKKKEIHILWRHSKYDSMLVWLLNSKLYINNESIELVDWTHILRIGTSTIKEFEMKTKKKN